jgi:hypothetical protein
VQDLPLAGARALLLFLLVVNTWVLPWYFTWPLVLVALGNPRSRTTWVVVGFSLSAPLSMYWAQAHFKGLEPEGFALYLAPLVLLAAWELGRRLRWGRFAAAPAPSALPSPRTAGSLLPLPMGESRGEDEPTHGEGARTLSSGGR